MRDLHPGSRRGARVRRRPSTSSFPGKLLAYNCSPSFNWRKHLSDAEIASFRETLAELGYRYQFVTLAGSSRGCSPRGSASGSPRRATRRSTSCSTRSKRLGSISHGVKKATAGNPESVYESEHVKARPSGSGCLDAPLTGGTAWLYAHERPTTDALDYLFIDEAGQVSLADAVRDGRPARGTSSSSATRSSSPRSLQGSHPDGAGTSVLEHLLGEHATIPPDRGLFLERTFRLHPDVCGYISEEFYEGRLAARPGVRDADDAARHRAALARGRARGLPPRVAGRGRARSPRRSRGCVAAGVERGGDHGRRARTTRRSTCCASCSRRRCAVGTVDKFQGQEAQVVLYSMASSSGEDIPRGLEFLLSRNRLNVAISRAQCLAYLVCSPRLLEVNCRTIEQMRLANALCRFVELAG